MKNLHLKTLSISVLFTALSTNVAFANDETSDKLLNSKAPMPSFSTLIGEFDIDKNKTLSAIELAKHSQLISLFKKMDFNRDKEVTEKEYDIFVKSMK